MNFNLFLIIDKLTDKIYKNSQIIFWAMCCIVILTVVFTIDKGLGFADEAWYLLHLNSEINNVKISFWSDYAELLLPKDIIALRICVVILFIISAIIFSIGLGKYFKANIYHLVLPISIFSTFILWMPVCFVPSYTSFNLIIFYIGLGLFLWSLSISKTTLSHTLALGSGFVFSQLIFVMITNVVFIFAVLLPATFFLSKNRNSSYKLCGAILLGIIAGILFFFIFITPFNEFVQNINDASKFINSDDSHGIIFMIKWTFDIFIIVIKEILIPAALLLVLLSNEKIERNLRFIVGTSLFVYFIFLLISDFRNDYFNMTLPTPFFIIALAIILQLFFSKQNKHAVIGLVLLSVPFFASLGTDVSFFIRATLYSMPIIVFICYQTVKNKQVLLLTLVFLLLVYSLCKFSIKFTTTSGWNGYAISQQTVKFKDEVTANGLKLDYERVQKLNELKAIIPPKSQIFVSSPSLWGYVYLLNFQTPFLYFKYNETREAQFLKKIKYQPKEVFLLESKKTPFPEKLYIKQKYRLCDTILLTTDNDLVLYRLK